MKRRPRRRWIQGAGLKKGALHRALGVPMGEPIPIVLLERAIHAGGKLAKRARLALTLRKLPHA